jgi:transposase-like protein
MRNDKARGKPAVRRFTPERRREFFRHLAVERTISAACRIVGIDRSTPRYWRDRDPDFAAAMASILGKPSALEPRRVRREGGTGAALTRRCHTSPSDADLERFLETLAETSNVLESARRHGLSPATMYRLRRNDAGFARRWLEALSEGYEELEMEMLARARFGVIRRADKPAFNEPVSLRLLIAHKEAVAVQRAVRSGLGVDELRDRLDRKIALVKESLDKRPEPGVDA